MPTYEYKCTKCGHRFECFQRMTDDPLEECEICQGKVKRLIGTGAGIIFKGSGFYCTDYRDENYHKAADKEKKETTDGTDSKTTETAAESTPAKKKETTSEGSGT